MHTADSCINIHEIQTNINIYSNYICTHLYSAIHNWISEIADQNYCWPRTKMPMGRIFRHWNISQDCIEAHAASVCVWVCVHCTHMKLINIMKMQCTSAVPLLESPLVSGSPSFCSCHNNYKNTHMHTECPLLTHCWLWLQFYNT